MTFYRALALVSAAWLVPTTALARQEREVVLTVLYDNTAFHDALRSDWGFACLITGKEKSILFDTGTRPEDFWFNYDTLDLEPWTADAVVLSHDHRDHTGSLSSFLDRNPSVNVYAPGSFPSGFFEKVTSVGAQATRVDAPLEICDGVHLTGPLGSTIVEQSLVVETPEGLVIVTGCSHPGIVEIVKKAKAMLGRDIHLVFGGFHLLRSSQAEVRAVIRSLKDLGVERVGATHCTGEQAIGMFREAYGDHFVEMGAGRSLRIKQDLPRARGPYLGQEPPGSTARVFAPGIVSTGDLEHSAPAFSPDGREVFWSLWRRPKLGEPQVILHMAQSSDGTWSDPQVASFSGKWKDGGPAFSPDGRRLYFGSKRPVEEPGPPPIWCVERAETGSGWSEPSRLKPAEESPAAGEAPFSDVLYHDTRDGIARSEIVAGRYARTERLPEPINTDALDWTPFAPPDESYLIFSSDRPGGPGQGDLYVCFRTEDGTWSQPQPLPETVNSPFQERFPRVSPDGRYLFFTRWTRKHDQDVYWVSADVIERLRDTWVQSSRGSTHRSVSPVLLLK